MNILITGGAGFIGHHLVEHFLRHSDHKLVSLDRLDTSGNLNRLSDLECWNSEKTRVKIVHHDLKAELNSLVASRVGHIDVILHVAASSHVDRSIQDPMSFVQDNVVGTVNLLQYARLANTPVLYFSTDEVFGPAQAGCAYAEDSRYNSGNPYAASKAAGEEFAVSFYNTYNLPVTVTHTMNVFGERQHPEKFVPLVIRSVRDGKVVKIHADKLCQTPGSRFYIHARNVAHAVEFVVAQGFHGEKFNIVGEREVNNLELAQLVAKVVGKPLHYELVDFHSSRPGHDLWYALDGKKLSNLGLKFDKTFEASLEKTVTWYLSHPEWL